jgi:hypothetical protein
MWPWRRRANKDESSRDGAEHVQHVVDDRVLVLGLDELYRDSAKRAEATELLGCARRVAADLCVGAAVDSPIEGYYGESHELTEYFQLMRALQATPHAREAQVKALPEYQRLLEFASSPHLGLPTRGNGLLPVARDSLSAALLATRPDWSVPKLVEAAAREAESSNDFSLVGMAARMRDPVLLAAVRETVVLYAEVALAIGLPDQREPAYVWRVSPALVELAQRFVSTANAALHAQIPIPEPASAEAYWAAFSRNEIVGRCVRIGYDEHDKRQQHYHWAIRQQGDVLQVHDFWDLRHWTTTMYRQVHG